MNDTPLQRMANKKKHTFEIREKTKWASTSQLLTASHAYSTVHLTTHCTNKLEKAMKAVHEAKRIFTREAAAKKYRKQTEHELEEKEREVSEAILWDEAEMVPTTQEDAYSDGDAMDGILKSLIPKDDEPDFMAAPSPNDPAAAGGASSSGS
jgi:hypothetical protein